MKNKVWYQMRSLDGISELALQLNNTTIIDNNRSALICFIFIYYLLFWWKFSIYYSVHFIFFSVFQFKMVIYSILYDN